MFIIADMKTSTIHCAGCNASFAVTDDDRIFLDKLSPVIAGTKQPLPEPTLCPDCREQRRLTVANQLFLYKRTCDLSGETMVSNIHPDSPYTVYKQELWFSDQWEPLSFGRDYDFNRPFFDQWQDLSLAVPRPSLFAGFQIESEEGSGSVDDPDAVRGYQGTTEAASSAIGSPKKLGLIPAVGRADLD